MRKIRSQSNVNTRQNENKNENEMIQSDHSQKNSQILGSSLSDTLEFLQNQMGGSDDFVTRKIAIPVVDEKPLQAAVCYIDGLIDQQQLSNMIEEVLQEVQSRPDLSKDQLSIGGVETVLHRDELITAIMRGSAAVIIEGSEGAVVASIPGGVRRTVEEPSTQTVVRGPKEGFTEDIAINMSLLRRKIRAPELRFESRIIGRYTQTKVVVAYVNGIANPNVVKEVLQRLDRIDTDSILEGGYIEEFIQDKAFTPFPTISNSERPDAIAGNLLDGQIAIMVDGTPFVLIAPVTFFKFFQASEDYYQRYDISTFLRNIRLLSFLIAMILPSFYIAVTTFQQEMIPTTLLVSLAAQREGAPLPALFEALLMELTFEIIREAGVRMPRVIGPAISIVGALVLGQSAVQAGLVSAAMVIVVSFTAIASFVIPNYTMSSAVRLVRFVLMLVGGAFGLFGLLSVLIPILIHLVSIKSFGIPYFMPVSPFFKANLKDIFLRAPWPLMKNRPEYINIKNKKRQASPRPTNNDTNE